MTRRDFLAIFGGAVALRPLAAAAQQSGKLHRIGFLWEARPCSRTRWKRFANCGDLLAVKTKQ